MRNAACSSLTFGHAAPRLKLSWLALSLRGFVLGLSFLGFPLLGSVPASAQTAALLPTMGGHQEIPPDVRDEVRGAAEEFLRTEDFLVLDQLRVESTLDEAELSCRPEASCMAGVRQTLATDLLVGLIIWGGAEMPDRPRSVHAAIVDGTGARYVGTAEVVESVATAVRDALRAGLRDQRTGPGPFLRVEGTHGANVELDHAAVGSIPLTVRTEPGEHELRVHLADHQAQVLTVTIGEDSAHTTRVEVRLRPEEGGGAEPTPESAPDLVANLLLAGGLSLAGVAVAIAPLYTLATTGECVEPGPGNLCAERVTFGAGSGVLLGVGGLLFAAGIVVAAWQPLVIGASASPGGAQLQLRGSF